MKVAFAVLTSALALALFSVARAGSPMPVQMKCAVGGKKFTYISTASMSRWGSRPDGKPYGSWTFPTPLPECPDNRLVMYREFKRDEIKRLKTLLASSEYRALVSAAETPYYRAYWLMGKLPDAVLDRAWVLLQASWQADGQAGRKARYQQEFVQLVASLPKPGAGEDDFGWIVMQFRAANALRELARFDEALQRLDAVPMNSLDVPIPEEKVTGTTPGGHGKMIENYAEIQAAKDRRGWLQYPQRLRAVIERRDASPEPLDMIPARVAAALCEEAPATAPGYQDACETADMRALLDRRKKNREQSRAATHPAPVATPPVPAKPD